MSLVSGFVWFVVLWVESGVGGICVCCISVVMRCLCSVFGGWVVVWCVSFCSMCLCIGLFEVWVLI